MDYSIKEDLIEYIFNKIKYLILPSENNNYRSKILQSNILLYCVVLILVLKIGVTIISINFPKNIFFADITKIALENFANQTRQSMGLEPLIENQKLNQAAQLKAENMVQNQYFAHTSPTGITPWYWFLKVGYNYKYAGENLAIGFFDSKEVYNAWLNSPSHKANILNPKYVEVGTAVLNGYGQNNAVVVVQVFGSPLPKNQAIAKNNNNPTTGLNSQVKINDNIKPEVVVKNEPETEIKETKENINDQITINENNQMVLSQSTSFIDKESDRTGKSGIYYKIMNYILYGYNGLLQDIIYGFFIFIFGILLTLTFFNFNNYSKELIFRAVLIITLLSVSALLDSKIIISLIPHQIII